MKFPNGPTSFENISKISATKSISSKNITPKSSSPKNSTPKSNTPNSSTPKNIAALKNTSSGKITCSLISKPLYKTNQYIANVHIILKNDIFSFDNAY